MHDYYVKSYELPGRKVYAAVQEERVISLSLSPLRDAYLDGLVKKAPRDMFSPGCGGLEKALRRFFAGRDPVFDCGIRLYGTAFDHAVWKACMAIPYGETRSYGELAAAAGNPRAARAAGNALSRNPLLLIVPCHRVIAGDGSPGGFGGGRSFGGHRLKLELLDLEKGGP